MVGLLFVHNEGEDWIEDMKNVICNNDENTNCRPVLYFWWHQRPDGKDETLSLLKEQLKKCGFSPIFAKTKNKCYIFTAVDFIVDPVENLSKIQSEWKSKYFLHTWEKSKEELLQLIEKWIEEEQKKGKAGRTAIPKVLFVISSVTQVDCSKEVFSTEPKRTHLIRVVC